MTCINRAEFRKQLASCLNIEEFRSLCFDLHIDIAFEHQTQDSVSRQVIEYCERRGQLPELIKWCRSERSKYDWDFILHPSIERVNVSRLEVNKKDNNESHKKVVFITFAIEDETQRDFLEGQSLHAKSSFVFIDMPANEPYEPRWKEQVRTRIRRSDGVIALISKNSLSSSKQKWEINCVREEKKRLLAIWAYKSDRITLENVDAVEWTWSSIGSFINSL